MPTPTKGPRLGGGPAHERLLLANLATALFEHDRITTTEAKAKRMRPLAERLVTFAKRGDLAARRRVLQVVRDKGVVHRLFTEIAPDMAQREGGYTRITKIGPRKGDKAPMAVIELVREPVRARTAAAATRRAASTSSASSSSASAAATPQPAAAAQEAPAREFAGAVKANEDGSSPEAGYTVKGNADSMKYHVEGSRWYDATVAEYWFKTADDAAAAGFAPAGGEAAQAGDAGDASSDASTDADAKDA